MVEPVQRQGSQQRTFGFPPPLRQPHIALRARHGARGPVDHRYLRRTDVPHGAAVGCRVGMDRSAHLACAVDWRDRKALQGQKEQIKRLDERMEPFEKA